jgi:hypothetical protein
MRRLLLVVVGVVLAPTVTYSASVYAPFPKLKPGQRLCQASIPPGDPFYKQCLL